jgi:hypothetical protein
LASAIFFSLKAFTLASLSFIAALASSISFSFAALATLATLASAIAFS